MQCRVCRQNQSGGEWQEIARLCNFPRRERSGSGSRNRGRSFRQCVCDRARHFDRLPDHLGSVCDRLPQRWNRVQCRVFDGTCAVEGFAIAVDGEGDAYLAGQTSSSDFPTTNGAFQVNCPSASGSSGCDSAFVTVVATLPGILSAPGKLSFAKLKAGKTKSSNVTIKNSGKGLLVGT